MLLPAAAVLPAPVAPLPLPPCTKFTTLTPFSADEAAAANAELVNIDLFNLTVGLVRLTVADDWPALKMALSPLGADDVDG